MQLLSKSGIRLTLQYTGCREENSLTIILGAELEIKDFTQGMYTQPFSQAVRYHAEEKINRILQQ